jgi:hypothetical protein
LCIDLPAVFEITADDIALLHDEDIRTLVGLLCESEVRSRPTSSVTWGGHQNAPDGGLDVSVTLPAGRAIDGFVPRPAIRFQVKEHDMPRAKILEEMCPSGIIRPIIQELADRSGAYVIVSSKGSTADTALRNRRKAMADAVSGLANANALTLDFYDRTRLATWVRNHAGLIPWVREKVGKATFAAFGDRRSQAGSLEPDYVLSEPCRLILQDSDDEGPLAMQSLDIW